MVNAVIVVEAVVGAGLLPVVVVAAALDCAVAIERAVAGKRCQCLCLCFSSTDKNCGDKNWQAETLGDTFAFSLEGSRVRGNVARQ